MLTASILLATAGTLSAQTAPMTGATQRDGSQPTGTVLQPERRLQPELQPPPQNPQPFGAPASGSIGGPIQETGNYGSLGLGAGPANGTADPAQRGSVQPDYRQRNDQSPLLRGPNPMQPR